MDTLFFLPGDVLRLTSHEATVLRAMRGVLWVTFEAGTTGRATATDHFLAAGETLALAAGEVAVVSAADARRGQAMLTWEPASKQAPAPRGLPWAQWLAPWRGWATARALAA